MDNFNKTPFTRNLSFPRGAPLARTNVLTHKTSNRTTRHICLHSPSAETMVKPCVLTGVALAAGIVGSGAFTGPALARGHVRPSSTTSSRSTNAW